MNDEEAGRIRNALARAVRAACPGWLAPELDDFVQAAMLRILQKVERESGAELNATYLWRTAHAVVVDGLRQRARRPLVPLDVEREADLATATLPDPEAGLLATRLRGALRDCLDAMVPPRRRAVALHLLGHTLAEVTKVCGWPAKRADNLLYRGLADLRRCLGRKGYGLA